MAMLIASGGGFVLEMAVEHFKGVTLFGITIIMMMVFDKLMMSTCDGIKAMLMVMLMVRSAHMIMNLQPL